MKGYRLDSLAVLPAEGGLSLLRHWAVLTKLPIALASALTALIGYRLAGSAWGGGCLALAGATLLLAMGAAGLNEIQERAFDAQMERTRHRPLPCGRISLAGAWIGVGVLVAAGLGGLACFGLGPALAGLLTLVWYNGVYTPMKRRTPWAVLPGALVGAIPPFIGWMAAGRWPFEASVLAFGLLIFLWQVPHFWALVLMYRQDYARGGFPTLDQRLSGRGLARLTFVWILLLASASAMIPVAGLVLSPMGLTLLGLANLILLGGGRELFLDEPREGRSMFHAVNVYALMVAALLLLEPWLR